MCRGALWIRWLTHDCYGNNRNYKVFPKELQVQFESYATYRSPTTLLMPALPTPPTMEIEEHDEEEDAEHPSANNLIVIGEINKRVTKLQAKTVTDKGV